MPKFLQEIVYHAIPEDCGVEIVGKTTTFADARILQAETGADVIVVQGGPASASRAVCGQPVLPTVIGINTSRGVMVSYEWTVSAADVGEISTPLLVNAIREAMLRRPAPSARGA